MWKPFSTLLWQWIKRLRKILLVFVQLGCENPCHSYLFDFFFWRPLNWSPRPMNVILSHVSNCARLSFPCSSSSPSWLKSFRTRSGFHCAGEFMFVVEALIMDWRKVLAGFSKELRLIQLELCVTDDQGCEGYGVPQFDPFPKNCPQESSCCRKLGWLLCKPELML